MAKKRVLLDVDGVIADFTGLYFDIVQTVLPYRELSPEMVKEWDVGKALKLNGDDLAKVHRHLFAPGAASRIKLLPGARDAVVHLFINHSVFFVTSPMDENPTWVFDRALWFERHFGKAYAKRVMSVHEKYPVAGDVFVDDKPENIVDWATNNPRGTAFLWEAPYNEEFVATRARTGQHFLPRSQGVWHEVKRFGQNMYATNNWEVVKDVAEWEGYWSA